jgi:hypothetical protein
VKGYEHHEIARLLRCSVGNSKSQLHKAKARMRELLGLQRGDGSRAAAQKTAAALETLAAADAVSRLQPVDAQTWESASEAAA